MRGGLLARTFLVALAALSVGCGGEAAGQRLVVTDDPELARVASALLPDLARRSGLELKAPVRLARRSRTELISYLRGQLDRELPEARARDVEDSYRLLGLTPDGFDLRSVLLSVYTEQVAGFYDPDSTALFVMDDQPAAALETVLIHELVHAVQDQSVDLDALTSRERGNDRQTAAQAAIEGHATLVMMEYLAESAQHRPVDLTRIPDFSTQVRPALAALGDQYPALSGAPRVIQESLLFPYLEGAGWVQRLWRERGGRPSPLGAELPQSTEQVLSTGAPPLAERDEPTELAVVTAAPARYSNSLGAMETGVLLRVVADADSVTAAQGWDGDRFALVDGSDGPSLAWASVWDDDAARDRFVATLRAGLGRLPKAATVEALTIDGRPGALLQVGSVRGVAVSIVGDRP